jgi:hypothetical protein
MVYGWNEYLKEKPHKNPGLKKYLIVVVIAILVVFACFVFVLIFHPWIDVDAGTSGNAGDRSADFVFTNIGLMGDKNVEIELSTHSTCTRKFPDKCELSNSIVECLEFSPGDSVTFSCEAGPATEAYTVDARSTYQIIMSEYSCNQNGCQEKQSFTKGTSPVYWSYILIYPLDLLSYITG